MNVREFFHERTLDCRLSSWFLFRFAWYFARKRRGCLEEVAINPSKRLALFFFTSFLATLLLLLLLTLLPVCVCVLNVRFPLFICILRFRSSFIVSFSTCTMCRCWFLASRTVVLETRRLNKLQTCKTVTLLPGQVQQVKVVVRKYLIVQ